MLQIEFDPIPREGLELDQLCYMPSMLPKREQEILRMSKVSEVNSVAISLTSLILRVKYVMGCVQSIRTSLEEGRKELQVALSEEVLWGLKEVDLGERVRFREEGRLSFI